MTRKQQNVFTYLIMNTIMCTCMSMTALLVSGAHFTIRLYGTTLLQSLVICNLCTLLFRVPLLAETFALRASGYERESRKFVFCSGIANATINTFFMNTFMTLLNVGFCPAFFGAWLRAFPALEIVSVVVAFTASPIAAKWVRRHV